MACAAIKRSLDWDPLYNNNTSTSSGSSSGPNACPSGVPITGSSSPATRMPPHKRLRSGPTTPLRQSSPFDARPKSQTAFAISASIQQEVRRLQRQQQHQSQVPQSLLMQVPRSCQSLDSGMSPVSSSFAQSCGQSLLSSPHSPPSTCAQAAACGQSSGSSNNNPVFTFKQVSLICERLLREQEQSIREEYDKVLETKLAEQYDTFVKFTYDQIQKRFESAPTPSYLS